MRMILLMLCLLCLPRFAMAAELDYTAFSQIPVQQEGRIKPVDSFARTMLAMFSGHQSLGSMSADAWLAETLFDPAQALNRPVFRIFRPDFLDLPAREKKYYSYAELAPALQRKAAIIQKLVQEDGKNWSEDQRELMRLNEASIIYTQLLRSFSFVLPLNITPPGELVKAWNITEEKAFTVQEYRRYASRLQDRVKKIIRAKGDDPAKYSKDEKDIAAFAMNMQVLEQAGENNILFRIVPGQWDGAEGTWFSPWAVTEAGQGSPQSAAYVKLWQDMAIAYLQQDASAWKTASEAAAQSSLSFTPAPSKITLELLYNKWQPVFLAMGFYLAAFLGFVFYSLRGNLVARALSLGALTAGALLQVAAIAARVLILSRPPVGTLYESILFVAALCVVVAIILEILKKDGNGLWIGAVTGLLLLFTAQGFAEDDTMKMLVAVLNTNFWLATHVLCITMGYGWCIIVALLAHAWLVRTALGKNADDLVLPMNVLALVALFFTAIGTILGGIWADQSWGRFWGWDPKENGALLIVLWLIWILHGKISGHLNRAASISMLAGLGIIVGLSWFGVNLLSVGLHSYGFITGVAGGLGAFCTAELLLIGFLWHRVYKRETTA